MEGEPVDGIELRTVFVVARHWMAEVGGMDADLVLPAGFQLELGDGEGVFLHLDRPEGSVMGHGVLRILLLDGGGDHFQGLGMLPEPGFDGPFRLFQNPFQDGCVFAFDHGLPPFALQQFLRPLVLREDDESGCPPVEAVDDPDLLDAAVGFPAADQVLLALGFRLLSDIFIEEGIEGQSVVLCEFGGFPALCLQILDILDGKTGFRTAAVDCREAGRLVHDEQVFVLIDHPDAGRFNLIGGFRLGRAGDGNALRKDQQAVSGAEGMVERRHAGAVDDDLPLAEQVPDPGPALVREQFKQVLQQRCLAVHREFLADGMFHMSMTLEITFKFKFFLWIMEGERGTKG